MIEGIIRWSIQNRFVVLFAALGLMFVGGVVVKKYAR